MSVSSAGFGKNLPYDRPAAVSIKPSTSPIPAPPASPKYTREGDAVIVSTSSNALAFRQGFNDEQLGQAKHFAHAALAISESQGLPPGKYDFTRMSANQMNTVMSDQIVNRKVSQDSFIGLMATLPDYYQGKNLPDTPVDFVSNLKQAMTFQTDTGNVAGAAWLQISISALGKYKVD